HRSPEYKLGSYACNPACCWPTAWEVPTVRNTTAIPTLAIAGVVTRPIRSIGDSPSYTMFLDLEEPPLKECHYAPITTSAASVTVLETNPRGSQIVVRVGIWHRSGSSNSYNTSGEEKQFRMPMRKRYRSISRASIHRPFSQGPETRRRRRGYRRHD